jgi:hypothetical protein
LIKGLVPDHNTIANFRRISNIRGLENLLSVFTLFLSFFSFRNNMLPLKKLDITIKQPKFKLIMISHTS